MVKKASTSSEYFSVSETAEQEAMRALGDWQEELYTLLGNIVGKLLCAVNTEVNDNMVALEKIWRKLKSFLTREQTKIDNAITAIVTPVIVTIVDQTNANDWLLKQVLIRAGILLPGQEVEPGILCQPERKPDPSFVGTMQLDVAELKGCLCDIVEVLREIRDRMQGIPHEYPGEKPAEDMPIKIIGPDVDIDRTLYDYPPAPVEANVA